MAGTRKESTFPLLPVVSRAIIILLPTIKSSQVEMYKGNQNTNEISGGKMAERRLLSTEGFRFSDLRFCFKENK